MKYEMQKDLAQKLITAYENKLVFPNGHGYIFSPKDYSNVFTFSQNEFNTVFSLLEKHHDSTYGSIFPSCLSLTGLGYKYAKYWLAYAELDEAVADDPTESLPV